MGVVYTEIFGAYYKNIQNILFVCSEMKQETRLPVGKASVFEQSDLESNPSSTILAWGPQMFPESQSSTAKDCHET